MPYNRSTNWMQSIQLATNGRDWPSILSTRTDSLPYLLGNADLNCAYAQQHQVAGVLFAVLLRRFQRRNSFTDPTREILVLAPFERVAIVIECFVLVLRVAKQNQQRTRTAG